MTSELISEPAGPRFGPYILTAVLGRGGMGVVYRAFDTAKGRTVALKVLIPELAADRAFQDRFRRESKRAACHWAVDELASVLGLDSADARPGR